MSSPNIPTPPQNGSSRVTTRLLATGFNAHSQITPDTTSDIYSLIPICETTASDLQVLFAGWSQTLITASGGILCLGHDQDTTKTFLPKGHNHDIKAATGNHNGLLLTLTSTGVAHILSSSPQKDDDKDEPPLIGHIASAQNGKVALIYQQTPTAQLSHILSFNTFSRFQNWLRDPSGEGNYPDSHQMLPGRPLQLLANTGVFMLLMEGGEVYTWGDARYGSLGRSVSTSIASEPGIVEALGGLKIRKIAAGGWICAALSEDGAAYIWGTTTPGTKARINPLKGQEGEDVTMVEISGGEDGEPLDVVDVGVGDDHIAVVVEGKRLFVVGENKNGQLGLGDEEGVADWMEVKLPGGFEGVWCGPLATFVSVRTQ